MGTILMVLVFAEIGGVWLGKALGAAACGGIAMPIAGAFVGSIAAFAALSAVAKHRSRPPILALIAVAMTVAVGILASAGWAIVWLGGSWLLLAPIAIVAIAGAGALAQSLLHVEHRLTTGMGALGILAAYLLAVPGPVEWSAFVLIGLLAWAGPLGAHLAWRRM